MTGRGPAALPFAGADDLALLAALNHKEGRFLYPFARAFEAGLWLVWVTRGEIIAVARPAVRIRDDRLHSETGPAVKWPDGARYWFVRGVKVPAELVTTPPDRLDPRMILREMNVEVRKEIVRRIGLRRIFETLGGTTVDREGSYEKERRRIAKGLWRMRYVLRDLLARIDDRGNAAR